VKLDRFPHVVSVDVEYVLASQWFDSKPSVSEKRRILLVDVRKTDEMAVSTIPGAIAASEFREILDDFTGTVITFCTAGGRAGMYACELLKCLSESPDGGKRTNIDIRVLRGGIIAWLYEGLPIWNATTHEMVNQAHGFRKELAGFVPEKIQVVGV